MNIHTFAICAYRESSYLEECIQSILHQTIPSNIILVTSTPCNYITNLCNKYNITCYLNEGESGITQDWNFAYSKCNTPLLTIAHQDDIYFQHYTETLINVAESAKKPLIYFTNYFELRNGVLIKENRLLKIKRMLLFPLGLKVFQNSVFVRRRILSLGNSICCPSVTYFKSSLPEPVFRNHFRSNEDWEAWEMISKLKGQFLYCKKPLMAHRIHEDSETSAVIQASGRTGEDIEMFEKFWPKWLAIKIAKLYRKSEASNFVEK